MEKEGKKRIIRILATSDTHNKHQFIEPEHLPPADIFIHAGDFTRMSRKKELEKFRKFLLALPYKHKIVIPGNHDFGLMADIEKYKMVSESFKVKDKEMVDPFQEIKKIKEICTLLLHQEVQIQGLRIFGSPYVISDKPMGFTYLPKEGELVWANLPKNIDVLVTHCPPFGVLDVSNYSKVNTGCKALMQSVERMQPKVHIFGHIHQGHGCMKQGDTMFYNVGYLDDKYQVAHNPVLIEVQVDEVEK